MRNFLYILPVLFLAACAHHPQMKEAMPMKDKAASPMCTMHDGKPCHCEGMSAKPADAGKKTHLEGMRPERQFND